MNFIFHFLFLFLLFLFCVYTYPAQPALPLVTTQHNQRCLW